MKAINNILINKISVKNMRSARGTTVANQFIITTEHGVMFRSYESNIAFIPNDEKTIYLGADWNYSTTTAKYRNQFLGLDKKEIEARIKDGRAVIVEAM